MSDIVIDLETLGLEPNAVIISIGLCKIDLQTGMIEDKMYKVINRQQQIDNGRTVTASTIDWWSQQSEDARKVFVEKQIDLSYALLNLCAFIDKDDVVWGNGPTLDLTLLGTLFGLRDFIPWHFRNENCFRTIRRKANEQGCTYDIEFEFIGVKHNALDDAVNEAIALSHYWRFLNK